jgi:hypothetical protein
LSGFDRSFFMNRVTNALPAETSAFDMIADPI